MIHLETILIIIEQSLLHLPLLIGAYISISLIKTPDLSIESAYVFGAFAAGTIVSTTQTMPHIIGLIITMIIALCGGALVGITSSILTQHARIPHLLSSIITTGIFHGINQLLAGTYLSLSDYKNLLAYDLIPFHPEIPILTALFILLSIIGLYFFKTQLGYSFAVFGYNSHFFANYGISSSYVFINGIVIANALAGLGGYLIAQSNGFADITMGFGKILLCITALILGKLLYNKPLSLITPIAGLCIYFTIQQLLLKIGFDLRYFAMVQALVILAALITQYSKNRQTHSDQLGV